MIRKLLIAFPIIISLMLAGCFGETSVKQYRIGHVETAKTVEPPAEKPAKKKEKIKKVKKKKSRKEKDKITAAKRKKEEKKIEAVVSKPQVTEKKTETAAALQIERYRLNEMEKTVEALKRTVNLQQESNQQLEERLGAIQSQGTGKAETAAASQIEHSRLNEMEKSVEALRRTVNLQQERNQKLEDRLGTIQSQGTGKAKTAGASTLEGYRIKELEETIEVLRNMVNLQQERIQLLEKRLGTIRRRR